MWSFSSKTLKCAYSVLFLIKWGSWSHVASSDVCKRSMGPNLCVSDKPFPQVLVLFYYLDLFFFGIVNYSFFWFFCINIPVKYIYIYSLKQKLCVWTERAFKMWNKGDAANDWWHTQTLILRLHVISSPKGGTFKWQILSWLMQCHSIYVTFISQLYFKMLDLWPSQGDESCAQFIVHLLYVSWPE